MNDLLSWAYGQAGLCAVAIAAAYGLLGFRSWARHRHAAHTDANAMANEQALAVPRWEGWALLAAVLAHSALLAATVPHHGAQATLNLGFAQALSVAACVGVWLLVIESRWVAVDGLRPLALSLPAVAVLLGVWVAPTAVRLHGWAALHVLLAIAAHGVALLAAGHAALLLALNTVLRNPSAGAVRGGAGNDDSYGAGKRWGWAQTLALHCPPLVVLERLLLRLSLWVAGLLALTVALGATGGVLKFDHKTVLTVMSLLAWLAVAWGYARRGWRGAALCRAVWVATGLLLLAYIGSRFVLQALLHRV
jgi:ABC-type uncharacterized transport system permease subunit